MTVQKQQGGDTDSESYRDGFRNLSLVINVQAAVIFVLTGVLLYMVSSYVPQDSYYAETMQEKRMRIVGLGEPYVNQQKLMLWAAQAATQVLTFGFSDVNERFSESRKLFTDKGWQTFNDAFISSALLKSVLDLRQVITTAPLGEPTMVSEGVTSGVYTWIVDAPVLLTVRAGDSKQTQTMRVRMWIVRMPTTEKPDGIGINFWMSY